MTLHYICQLNPKSLGILSTAVTVQYKNYFVKTGKSCARTALQLHKG